MSDFEDVETGLDSLSDGLGHSKEMMHAFTSEMVKFQGAISKTGHEIKGLEGGLSRGLRGALEDLAIGGGRLSDVLRELGLSIADTIFKAAVTPVTDQLASFMTQGIGNLLGGVTGFANGGVISQGQVHPFAKGGVLQGAATFPMKGGTGLMGEAGPEAIMPLKRGADGRLGVAASGGNSVNVTMNISTPDAQSFQRSQSQIAAQMSRAMQRSNRNM